MPWPIGVADTLQDAIRMADEYTPKRYEVVIGPPAHHARELSAGRDPRGQVVTQVPPFMSSDRAVRKGAPVATGPFAYFPDALVLVSVLCRIGNDQHSPGQPLHWAKDKSADELDALARHFLDELKDAPVDPEFAEIAEFAHATQMAWRALAHLQRKCDAWRAAHTAHAPGCSLWGCESMGHESAEPILGTAERAASDADELQDGGD